MSFRNLDALRLGTLHWQWPIVPHKEVANGSSHKLLKTRLQGLRRYITSEFGLHNDAVGATATLEFIGSSPSQSQAHHWIHIILRRLQLLCYDYM